MPNRVALAAMTNQQSHADGTLSDAEYDWLARRADGGFGMLATCAANVSLDGKAWPGELGIDRDEELPGLTRLAARLRVRGGLPIVQIFHGGVRAAQALSGTQVWSASTWQEDKPGFETPRTATLADLERVIHQFAESAERARRAGFAGVELHGAHGYLLSQFLSSTMNPRTDGWGGDLVGRARLVREATRAVRARCGEGFTVGVRLSLEDFGNARGMDLDDNLQVAAWLAEDGVDARRCRRGAGPRRRRDRDRPRGDHQPGLARSGARSGVAAAAAARDARGPDRARGVAGVRQLPAAVEELHRGLVSGTSRAAGGPACCG